MFARLIQKLKESHKIHIPCFSGSVVKQMKSIRRGNNRPTNELLDQLEKKMNDEEMRKYAIDVSKHTYQGTICNNCHKDFEELKVKKKLCARCLSYGYCSKKCQIIDWKRGHKKMCIPYQTRGNERTYSDVNEKLELLDYGQFKENERTYKKFVNDPFFKKHFTVIYALMKWNDYRKENFWSFKGLFTDLKYAQRILKKVGMLAHQRSYRREFDNLRPKKIHHFPFPKWRNGIPGDEETNFTIHPLFVPKKMLKLEIFENGNFHKFSRKFQKIVLTVALCFQKGKGVLFGKKVCWDVLFKSLEFLSLYDEYCVYKNKKFYMIVSYENQGPNYAHCEDIFETEEEVKGALMKIQNNPKKFFPNEEICVDLKKVEYSFGEPEHRVGKTFFWWVERELNGKIMVPEKERDFKKEGKKDYKEPKLVDIDTVF